LNLNWALIQGLDYVNPLINLLPDTL